MKRNFWKVLIALALVVALLAGCGSGVAKDGDTIKDRTGAEYTAIPSSQRIVSLAPSTTEILVGLGVGDKLVGVDYYSADVEGIPSELPYFDMMEPNVEELLSLQPDAIFTSDLNMLNGEGQFEALKNAGVMIVLSPLATSIEDIQSDITFLGKMFGVDEAAKQLNDTMDQEIKAVTDVTSQVEEKKTVYFEISPAPDLFTMGGNNFINEMIELAGAENIFKDKESTFAPSAEDIIAADPDVILTNCNFVKDPVGDILSRNGFNAIDAVLDEKVYLIDANASSRQSQNVTKALLQIAQAVYPELYE